MKSPPTPAHVQPLNRRRWLAVLGSSLAGLFSLVPSRRAEGGGRERQKEAAMPDGYDPTRHRWLMALDINRCIGCALCVAACKTENKVPPEPTYFRTWIERYIIRKPGPGSGELRGSTIVDSPNGGRDGFPPSAIPRDQILRSFFVPKLCNLCEQSPCTQACPVGATFQAPDGVVLVDPHYCIGCGFCIQSCPYGCRFLNPNTRTAEKCTLCYHRITRGLKPACVEVCPGGARIFGDAMHPLPDDPLSEFVAKNKVQTLKPYLGTGPRVLYAGMDKEVR
ncbi:MAG: 4Fe-4S dicluster domain-containing protein [Candidatus Omnitrophica bacterium]|nr:4Fe-4S dicluster domain-containing protein [Candidatus Omnitrophota bacterium]